MLKDIAKRARKLWDSAERHHDVEYKLAFGDARLIGWVNSSAHNAMLHTLSMQVIGNDTICTYLQVRRGGLAVRALTRLATGAEVHRWTRVYPEDKKVLTKLMKVAA
jgi:hypothetical protein